MQRNASSLQATQRREERHLQRWLSVICDHRPHFLNADSRTAALAISAVCGGSVFLSRLLTLRLLLAPSPGAIPIGAGLSCLRTFRTMLSSPRALLCQRSRHFLKHLLTVITYSIGDAASARSRTWCGPGISLRLLSFGDKGESSC
jgi:hypothetical protein